jgi:DNA-binding XRE family transcriptional regulator
MSGRNIKLQDLRSERHWTLRAAAQHIGVTKTVLFNAEQGVMPRVDHAIQIAGQYNRSVEELWAPPARVRPGASSSAQHNSPRKPAGQTSVRPRPKSNPDGYG